MSEFIIICFNCCSFVGFAYADTPFTGASIIVTTNDDEERAERYAEELAGILMRHRQASMPQFLSAEAAVIQAARSPS